MVATFGKQISLTTIDQLFQTGRFVDIRDLYQSSISCEQKPVFYIEFDHSSAKLLAVLYFDLIIPVTSANSWVFETFGCQPIKPSTVYKFCRIRQCDYFETTISCFAFRLHKISNFHFALSCEVGRKDFPESRNHYEYDYGGRYPA